LHTIASRTVKVENRASHEAPVTAKGGLALFEALARRMGLWRGIVKKELPARKDPSQGFTVEAAVSALVHGLLAGAKGFSATEPMLKDAPLLALLGLDAAPSAETVERVVKHLASTPEGIAGANRALRRQAAWLLAHTSRRDLLAPCAGEFLALWADGSLLEVEGKDFDSLKWIGNKKGQMCVACFLGPYIAGMEFASEKVGEETIGRDLAVAAHEQVARPLGLADCVLVLMDSLYGDGPTLDALEAMADAPDYIVGACKLARAQQVMHEQPECAWRETGPNEELGWEQSAVALARIECEGWKHKRLLVCRRWRPKGELYYFYAAVITSLRPQDPRVARLMSKWGLGFEETIWRLYAGKQAMENQWKDPLSDLGLHHPPCARASVNAVFYALAALGANLAAGVRRIGFAEAPDRGMRLWRLRRELIDLAARVVTTGRVAVARLLDARAGPVARAIAAMHRLARC